MDKTPQKPLQFSPINDGLGFHPFSDGLPYAPIGKSVAPSPAPRPTPAPAMGTGAVSAGKPRFVPPSTPAGVLRTPRVSVPVAVL